MTDPTKALEAVRTAIAGEMTRTRIQADALDDLERLVAQLERACVRHVAAAREAATVAERERCAHHVIECCPLGGSLAVKRIKDGTPCL